MGADPNRRPDLRKHAILALAIVATLTSVGAKSSKFVFTWTNPNYSGAHFVNILVLGINGRWKNRAEFEDRLPAAIARPGIQAVPSYSLLPRSNSAPVDMNQLRDVIRGQNPLSRLPVGANRNKFLLDGQAGWRAYLDRNKRYH